MGYVVDGVEALVAVLVAVEDHVDLVLPEDALKTKGFLTIRLRLHRKGKKVGLRRRRRESTSTPSRMGLNSSEQRSWSGSGRFEQYLNADLRK